MIYVITLKEYEKVYEYTYVSRLFIKKNSISIDEFHNIPIFLQSHELCTIKWLEQMYTTRV